MAIPITLGLIYTLMLVLNFVKKDWPTGLKKYLMVGHLTFAGLILLDIILLLTNERTFSGLYADRIAFWGLFITGGLFFSLFKGKHLLTKIYFGIYLFYPIMAMATFFIDRIMFVLIASPILVSVTLPETYYKNNKLEIRGNTGLMAPRRTILLEKNWLTEKQIGQKEYSDGDDIEILGIEITGTTADSINVRLNYRQNTQIVTFKTSH